MNLDIAFRELEPTEGIRVHIEEKAVKLEKYLKEDEHIRVVVGTKGRGKVQFAEIYWHDKKSGKDFFAKEEGNYLYTQIDDIFDAITAQIQKSHSKKVQRQHRKVPLKKISAEPVSEKKTKKIGK